MIEYFTPIFRNKNPLDELRFKFKDTLNLYLRSDDQIKKQTLFDRLDGDVAKIMDLGDEPEDLS